MSRKRFNSKIVKLLDKTPLKDTKINGVLFKEAFEKLSKAYPLQRAGQIITNYICTDYRDGKVSKETKLILETLFPEAIDPFFEESKITYKRLAEKYEPKKESDDES